MCCPSITVAARKSRLGDKFRGKFYRLNDDKHTEEKFRAELAVVLACRSASWPQTVQICKTIGTDGSRMVNS